MSAHQELSGAIKTEAGVVVNGISVSPIVEQCNGCERIRVFADESFCSSYPSPTRKWTLGQCNFATHVAKEKGSQSKVNPLKASKRAAKGKK